MDDDDGLFIEKYLLAPDPEGQKERKLHVSIAYQNEHETGATIYDEDNAIVYWCATGDDLTADELNTVIRTPTGLYTLWEWIMENLDGPV